jgi:tetratricopeptide (TPR) repeat protein
MDWRSIGLISDPASELIGLISRVFGRGYGYPPGSDEARLLGEQCKLFKYVEPELRALRDQNPHRPEPLLVMADILQEDHKWEELLALSRQIRRRFPSLLQGYRQEVTALIGLKQVDEAERVALTTARRFPRLPAGLEAYAGCAEQRGDLELVAKRWDYVRRRFPLNYWPWLRTCDVLVRLGRLEEAENLAARMIAAFPKQVTAWAKWAEIAGLRGDWHEMDTRCNAARAQYPGLPQFYAQGARARRQAGEPARAAELIVTANFLFPNDKDVQTEHAELTKLGHDPNLVPLPGQLT